MDNLDMSVMSNMDNLDTFEYDEVSLVEFQTDLAIQVINQLNDLGQSGLEVMTSGGKSYIAAYVMQEYVNKHRDCKILWLAPKSALNNVKKKTFSKMALRNRITYLGYEELARKEVKEGSTLSKELGLDESIKLIVFDECHRTLAAKTFENIKLIMEELKDSNRLAMSATPKRYGGVNTFDILVPKVTEPVTFDLRDAAAIGLLPNVNYILANVNISRNDFETLSKYKKLVQEDIQAQKLYEEVEKAFNSFEFKLERDLTQLLKSHVNSDGSDGERHIAFFSSIEQLRSMKAGVEQAFASAYTGCKINMLEYHSGVSVDDNNIALQQFVIDEPEANRIDVMLSVDKATESIHPDNVRSVMMFRGTQSIRVYLQQMGRGIMLKAYHPEDIVIFDFASNVDCINGSQSIYIGKSELADRGSDNLKYSNTIEDIKRVIMNQFGFKKGIEPKIGINSLSECLDKIKRLHSRLEMTELRRDINLIMNAYINVVAEQYGETKNIHSMIHSIESEINTMTIDKYRPKWEKHELDGNNPADQIKRTNLYKKYKEGLSERLEIVDSMLSSYRRQFLSSGVTINKDVYLLFKAMGHMAYLTAKNGKESELLLTDIDYIKEEIDKCGTIEQSSNTHAKSKLRKLRLACTKHELTSSICCYARRKNIDIEMRSLNVSDILDLCRTQADIEVATAFKPILRELVRMRKNISEEKEIKFEEWLDVTARLTVTRRKYSEFEMKDICTTYIYNRFKSIIRAFKLNQTETENGAKLLSAICKIDNGEYPNKMEESYIFEQSKTSNMSEYELKILKYSGKKVSKYAKEFEDNTEFMCKYNAAHDGDIEAIKEMMGYNRSLLDDRRKKLLNTNSFKTVKEEAKETVGTEVLLNNAKLMLDPNADYKKINKEISEALVAGTLTDEEVACIPFRDTELSCAQIVMSLSDEQYQEALNQIAIAGTPLNILVTRCSQTNCCTKDSIHNIVKIKTLKAETKQRLNEIYSLI